MTQSKHEPMPPGTRCAQREYLVRLVDTLRYFFFIDNVAFSILRLYAGRRYLPRLQSKLCIGKKDKWTRLNMHNARIFFTRPIY